LRSSSAISRSRTCYRDCSRHIGAITRQRPRSARLVRHLRRRRPSRRHAARSSRPEGRFRLRRSRHPRSSVVRHMRHGSGVAAVVPARSHPAGLLQWAAVPDGSCLAALRRSTGLCHRPVAVSVVHQRVVRHHLDLSSKIGATRCHFFLFLLNFLHISSVRSKDLQNLARGFGECSV